MSLGHIPFSHCLTSLRLNSVQCHFHLVYMQSRAI